MNVGEIDKYIKETLETYCKLKNSDSSFRVSAKHVIHIDENEFSELSKSKLEYNLSITQLRFAIIDINSKKYIIIIGTDNLTIDNDDFIPISINNVIFLSVVKSLELKVRGSVSYSYVEDIIYPMEDDKITGYDVDRVCELFEPFLVFEVPAQEVQNEFQIKTHIAKTLLANPEYIYLSFTSNTIKSYIQYYNSGNYDDNIFNSLLAYCWRYCFLDVYRCIEPIFRHLPLSGLKQEIGFPDTIDSLYEKIYNHCGWRPQETTSMETLFTDRYLSDKLLQNLRAINISVSPEENIGKSIYKLRNRIVHHQGVSSDIEKSLSNEKWNDLVSYLLDALVELRNRIPYDA